MAISKFDQFDFLIDIVPRDELKPAKRAVGYWTNYYACKRCCVMFLWKLFTSQRIDDKTEIVCCRMKVVSGQEWCLIRSNIISNWPNKRNNPCRIMPLQPLPPRKQLVNNPNHRLYSYKVCVLELYFNIYFYNKCNGKFTLKSYFKDIHFVYLQLQEDKLFSSRFRYRPWGHSR